MASLTQKALIYAGVLLLTSGIVWLAYRNALDNAFVFDDHLAITNNHDVKDPDHHSIWTDDIWGKELSAHDSHKSFRPLLMLLFRKLWQISSEARWFREVSLVSHVIATVLFYGLCNAVWNVSSVALGATALFAAHPIHVESVAAVVNMAEAFSSIFILGSYLLFLNLTKRDTHMSGLKITFSIVLWIILVIVASLFKETGITACLLVLCKTTMDLVLYTFAMSMTKSKKESLVSALVKNTRSSGIQLGAYMTFFITALLLLYEYMSFRTLMTSPHRSEILASPSAAAYNLLLKPIVEWQRESYLDSSQLLRRAENPFAQLKGIEKALSSMYLHCLYMMKLVYPTEQSPEYAFDCIPKVSSTQDIRFGHSLVAYGVLLALLLLGFTMSLYSGSSLWKIVRVDAECCSDKIQENRSVRDRIGEDNESSNLDDQGERIQEKDTEKDGRKNLNNSTQIESLGEENFGISQKNGFSTQRPEDKPAAVEVGLEILPGTVPSDAVLHTLLLFTVFFLPASGLVFKLGTLLAERLMYTPSMPVCMLISGATYTLSCSIGRLISFDITSPWNKSPKAWSFRAALSQILFCSVICAVTYIYAQRTIAYNPVWHDDNTLFVESLKVCPNSAKLNLQVSKVWSQKGDLKKARKHLNRAMEIDPDFCDTGYQDVVLTAAGEGKGATLDLAAEKAVKNLHCIYTNSGTISVLNQIWSAQLQSVSASGDKIRIYQEMEKQGDIALRGDVKFLAAQKFVEASSIAFEAQATEDAIDLTNKARKIVLDLEMLRSNGNVSTPSSNEEVEVTADLRCRIFTLSGLFRATVLAQERVKAQKKKVPASKKTLKRFSKEEKSVVNILRRAVFRDCKEAVAQLQYPDPAGTGMTGRVGGVAVEHLPLAINHLVSMWTSQTQASAPKYSASDDVSDVTRVEKVVEYSQNMLSVLYIAEFLRNRTSYFDHSNNSTAFIENEKIKDLCDTLSKLTSNSFHVAGTQLLTSGQTAAAVNSFRHSLFVYTPSNMVRAVGELKKSDSVEPANVNIEELQNVEVNKETCTAMHWLSETLVSLPDFSADSPLVPELVTYLQHLITCVKTKSYLSPKLKIPDLRRMVKSLTARAAELEKAKASSLSTSGTNSRSEL